MKANGIWLLLALAIVATSPFVAIKLSKEKESDASTEFKNAAIKWSKSLLEGEKKEIPKILANAHVEVGLDFVSFTTIGSGPFGSSGYAYSTSGYQPNNGLGGEPNIVKWEKIELNWYRWYAD